MPEQVAHRETSRECQVIPDAVAGNAGWEEADTNVYHGKGL